MYDPNQITYFAETDARNRNIPFGIKAKDRTRHVYVIGKTGMGKSTILENMAVQDIRNGNGFAFIDPHGKTADLFLKYIPEERINDVLYFAPFDLDYPISFNIMEDVGYDKRHLVVSGLMGAFKKIWQDAWSARMEYILSNTLLALLEYPDATLLSVNKMLSDKNYRKKVVDNITDTSVKSFWVDEFANYTERMAAEAVPAIQNKVGQFTSNPLIRNIIGQPKSSFDIREMMDQRKIMLINLSKGRIGEANANLLGSLLITKIYLSAMSRADVPEEVLENELPNFYLYVDEFQSFANESFADILSEARKYKLNLTIAHQYIEQMSEEVRAAVFGNVGTMITFRVGSYDAEVLEKEFAPEFTAQDIVNLGRFQIYLRLMIDSVGSKPFSAATLPPLEKPETNDVPAILEASRRVYGKPRTQVEEEVKRLVEMGRDESNGGQQQGGNSGGKKKGKGGGNNNAPEKKKPVIDEKTKNELQALLAKHTPASASIPTPTDEAVASDTTDKNQQNSNTTPQVQESPKQPSLKQEVPQQAPKEAVPNQSKSTKPAPPKAERPPMFVEQTIYTEPKKEEVPQEAPVVQRKHDPIDFSDRLGAVSVDEGVDTVITKPVKKQQPQKSQSPIKNPQNFDRDLKDDLSPMMVSPASRNDPKSVSPENKNDLASALAAAMGGQAQEASPAPVGQQSANFNQQKTPDIPTPPAPPVPPTPPQKMGSVQDAVNMVVGNVRKPEGSAVPAPQQQSPAPSNSANTAPNEVPEQELRSILEE